MGEPGAQGQQARQQGRRQGGREEEGASCVFEVHKQRPLLTVGAQEGEAGVRQRKDREDEEDDDVGVAAHRLDRSHKVGADAEPGRHPHLRAGGRARGRAEQRHASVSLLSPTLFYSPNRKNCRVEPSPGLETTPRTA